MDMVSSVVFSMSVLAGVGALLGWHVRQWKTAQARMLEKAELDYRRSQFRRRMQTTMLFGLATASLPFGLPLIRAWPRAGAIYWGVIVLLLLWAIVLGLADILAIKVFYGRLQHRNQLERARLEVEMRRIHVARSSAAAGERARRNGHGFSRPEEGGEA